jgi:protein-arginine kinase activator protein McsA
VGTRQIVPWYPHLLNWTDPMQEAIRQYNEQYVEAIKVFDEIHQLKEKKKKQEALTLWDSL